MKQTKLTRREFIGQAALAAATVSIVPRHVLGQGQTPPSEKLNLAGVGIGGQGYHDISQYQDEHFAALCDIDWNKARRAFELYPQARRYKDYREMLEKETDLDGVIIATPDHMHATVSIAAMRKNLNVYCEKPLTHSVNEAWQVGKIAAEKGVATQMGNQGQASEETRRIQEMMAAQVIGPVREVHVWTDRPARGYNEIYWPQGVARPGDTPAVPEGLFWDGFIGGAPYRPYHPAYHPFVWRGWWDFGTGALGDIGCHSMDSIFRALKLGHPTSVSAVSSTVNDETYPVASIVRYEFPARGDMPEVALTWYDGGLRPPRPDLLEEGRQLGTNGTLYVGDDGEILNGVIIPEEKRKSIKLPPATLPLSIGHYKEWAAACRGGPAAGSNFQFASLLTQVVVMGNIALRREFREQLDRRKLLWDAEKREFTNFPDANKYLSKIYRDGWPLDPTRG